MQIRIIITIGFILGLNFSIIQGQEKQQELYIQTGALGKVTITPSRDGKFFVSQANKEIKIWDAKTGTELRSLKQSKNCSSSFAISPDSKILAACGQNDEETILWDISTGEEIDTLEGTGEISFDLDGKTLRVFKGDGGFFWKLPLDEENSGESFDVDLEEYPNIPKFSPNGEIFAYVDGSSSVKKVIKLKSLNKETEPLSLKGHLAEIKHFVFSPDSNYLASIDREGTIKLWNAKTGKPLIHNFNCKEKSWVTEDRYPLAFNSDGKMFATVCHGFPVSALLWDTSTGSKIASFPLYEGNRDVYSLSFSQDSRQLIFGIESGGIITTEVKSGKIINYIPSKVSHDQGAGEIFGYGTPIALSPDGKFLANGGGSRGIRFWDLVNSNGFKLSKSDYDYPFAYSPKGKDFVCKYKNEILLVDLTGKKAPKSLFKEPEIINGAANILIAKALVFSPDAKMIALITYDHNHNHVLYLIDVATGKILHNSITGFRKDTDDSSNSSLAFSPNSEFLAVADRDKGIILWNTKTNQIEKTIKDTQIEYRNTSLHFIGSLAFSPDGKFLISGGDKSVNLWNVSSGELLNQYSTKSEVPEEDALGNRRFNMVRSVAFSSDGKFLVIGKEDGVIESSNVTYRQEGDLELSESIEMRGHTDSIISVLFSPDGKKIYSTSADTSIKIWNREDGKLLVTLSATSRQEDWIAVTPEGLFDGTPAAWKRLIWRFTNNTFDWASAETYFNEFFYPNLLQEVLNGKSPSLKAGQELEKIDRRQPKVEIASFSDQSKHNFKEDPSTYIPTITVNVEVADNIDKKKQPNHQETSGANDLRLFRNNSLVKLWRDDVFDTKKSGCKTIQTKPNEPRRVRCSAEITVVQGENNITAYAFNSANVKSEDATARIEGRIWKERGTLYVLAIGVNDYIPLGKSSLDLNFAVTDVEKITQSIKVNQEKLNQDVQLKQYAKTEIITLTDADATKENILVALRRFSETEKAAIPANASEKLKTELLKIKPTEPEDALIIHFSGHGTSREQRFYLLPHNFNNPKEVEKQAVSDIELNQILEKVDAGRLLMIIDACQSGQALGEQSEGRAPMNSKGLAQLAYDKGMLILTAAQSYQAALEAPRIGNKKIEHGLLTYALLEAMQNPQAKADNDGNKQLWEREWFDFAVREVPLLQVEAMKQRRIDLQNGASDVKGKSDLIFLDGDNPNDDPEKRRVQTPRVFYWREREIKPFILANH